MARGDLRGVHLKVGAYEFRVAPRRLPGVNAGIAQGARRRRALGKKLLSFHDPTIAMRVQGLLAHHFASRVAFGLSHRYCLATHGAKGYLIAKFWLRERFLNGPL